MQPLETVDSIEIITLVDNVSDFLSSTPNNTQTEKHNILKTGVKKLSGCCLCSAIHGFSLLINIKKDSQVVKILFDSGPDKTIFIRNIKNLNIDLSDIKHCFLSHGHWDHAGGFLALEKTNFSNNPIFHANQASFVKRGSKIGKDILPYEEIPSVDKLKEIGFRVHLNSSTKVIDDIIYWSGEIPRITKYEKGFFGHMAWSEKNKEWVDDPLILDEQYLALNIKDKGLVIFTACSHAGIVNVLMDVKNKFNDPKILCIIGGFHLAGNNESIIEQTIDDIKRLDIESFIPAHCTGIKATHKLISTFGFDKVQQCAVGKSFLF